ncbi:MAG TPA: hypothetical protein DD636_08305 [Anaerolineaceae bacterium]|jgi:uncharacterized protein YoxC|nr:hypothetical protein [Anaerolineaceae bacterium]
MSESLRETILLIVQIASLAAVILYVVKTAEMARETKKSAAATEKSIEEMVEDRNLEFAPYIVVYFDAQTDSPIFDLVIKNTGKTIANHVQVVFEPPLKTSLKNYDLEGLTLIHQPIPAIPPGYELRTSIDRLETRLESETLPKVYKVTVTFTGGLSDIVRKLEYLLDLNVFHGILETHKSSLTDLTHAVEDIPRHLEHLWKRTEQVSDQLVQLTDSVEKILQLIDNLEEISKAIEGLDGTMKSRNSKIW